jgi:CheY-like chemotaxis protein
MKHCLVVDDSAVIRKVARRILEELHFTASEAENGREALEQCRMAMPDAVLLDWNMAVMDGIAFLVALRKERGGRHAQSDLLHDRERHRAHHPCHHGGGQRIRHETLRPRHHRSQVS